MWSDNGNTFTLTIQDYNTETGSLQTWETATFQMLSSTPIPFNFNAEPIEGSPDESYLTYCVRGEPLELYDTNSQQLITLITPTGVDIICPLDDIAWSPNNLLAIASHQIPITEEETGGTITIWVINTGSLDDCTSSPTTVTDLIAAITDANGTSEADTICLTDSTYTFTTAHIPLNALPAITSEITIIGNGAALSRQAGSPLFGFFEVNTGGSLTLDNLTLSGGDVGNDTGGALVNEGGTVTLNNVTFSNNHANTGGAIDNENGSLTLIDSTFENNQADYGGAIDNDTGGTLSISGSTFTGNTAALDGGAIHNDGGTLTVTDSTFTTNTAGRYGGALDNTGSATISGSTFAGNSASWSGGAIRNTNTLTITDSVFSSNSATSSSTTTAHSCGGSIAPHQ
jgi:predicted outer membrane repeat protein